MSVESAQLIADAITQLDDLPIVKVLGIVADLAIVATAFFVWHQLRHSVLVREVRKVRAHERIAQWNEPHFVQRREGVLRYLKDATITEDEKVKRFNEDDSFGAAVVQILNFFEALAQGIRDGVINEKSARDFFGLIAKAAYDSSLPLIRDARATYSEASKDFEWLIHKWANDPAIRPKRWSFWNYGS